MTFEKGKSYTLYISSLGENRKCHIVELIENDMIVYKWFGKHKRWWHYFVESRRWLEWASEMAEKHKNVKITPH
jgi:hypothetical protein